MMQFLLELGTKGKLGFVPFPGQQVFSEEGFYLDSENNLWELFEGVFVNA